MGLSLLAFIAAFGIAVVMFIVARRGRHSIAARSTILVDVCLLAFTVFQGLVLYSSRNTLSPNVYLWHLRASYAALATAELSFLVFALSFPRWFVRWVRFIPIALVGIAVYVIFYIFTSVDYIQGTKFGETGLAFTQGVWFEWINLGTALFGVAAAGVHLTRTIQTDDSINRQRSAMAFLAVLVGVASIWAYQRYSISHPGAAWPIIAPAFIALGISALEAYALSISRLFDWRELARTVLAYAVLTLVIGVPTAGAVALLVLLGGAAPIIPLVGSAIIFVIAFNLARRFASRFFERLGSRREYRELLESGLAHIDLSAGRDAVLSELYSILTENLDFTDLSILIEDDRGLLKTAYSSSTAHATLDRGDIVRAKIEGSNVNVLLLSEAQADSSYEAIQKELLALFAALKAEVLIFAREGRRVIGVFAFGSRKIGGEYTDYDYDTFKSICGKLFVFAFYLKNVARESILYTVDRELALSDQIIRFALEHVAPVEHSRADAAWAMKSTRRLGGDFVDFVRIGKERWFFVLGDVSGKGLSASMNMLILKSMVRTFLRIEKDFAGLVQRVNAFIKEYLPRGSFFAGVFGYFDFEKGALYFLNCGVPAMFLYSPSFDAFIEVQGEGKVLGFVKDVTPYLKPRKLSLSPGTALMIATDGILDSENIRGERFGKERLKKAARDRLKESSRTIADGALEDLLHFTENRQEDDITLLVMKIK